LQIEVCVEKLETALAADKFGADRIELCSALDLGGLTPSHGLIESCIEQCSLDVYVMIRPKPGNFIYSDNEISIMKKDIEFTANSRADGVVFGCLTNVNELNIKQNKELLDLAKSLKLGVTFHRAFDFIYDKEMALNQLINMGFDRILTSGGKKTALEGINNIKHFVKSSKNKIEIMAGSGVNPANALQLANTGIDALHFTARKSISGENSLNMGNEFVPDIEKIKAIISNYKSF